MLHPFQRASVLGRRPSLCHVVSMLVISVIVACGGGSSGSVALDDFDYDHVVSDEATYHFGDHYSSNWRTDDWVGQATRKWNEAATHFRFDWDTTVGDQIGRIGKSHLSTGFGVRVDQVATPSRMSANFETRDIAGDGWYIWAIYGWTHEEDIAWPWQDGGQGWNNEFYIIFETTLGIGPAIGYTWLGSHEIEGITYDFLMHDMPWGTPNQTQWVAVSQSDFNDSVSIDIQPFLARWRTYGLANEFVVDLAFAIEGFADSQGSLILSDILIPALGGSNS